MEKKRIPGYQIFEEVDKLGLRTIHRARTLKGAHELFVSFVSTRSAFLQKALTKRAEDSRHLILPSIVTALDFGTLGEDVFYYTHYAVSSTPINRYLDSFMDPQRRLFTFLRLFLQVLDALDYMHRAKTTHRDLKTSHIRIDKNNNVIVEGFINSRTKAESKGLSNSIQLHYLSPEQLMGMPCDYKTDIYALGVIFFELITGNFPYKTNYAKVDKTKRGTLPSLTQYYPNIPKELDVIVMKMLSSRQVRYGSIYEIKEDLERFYSTRSLREKIKDLGFSIKNILSMHY